MSSSRAYRVERIIPDHSHSDQRAVPVEAPIAVEFNGIGYAVMMATPADLEDFAVGFALSERIVEAANEIEEVEASETELGWLLKIRIVPARTELMIDRVRVRVSESSCGLCGLENLEQIARPLPKLPPAPKIAAKSVFRAIEDLRRLQPLNVLTGGTHAAAFCSDLGEVLTVREDVGRHTALDKLIGALARTGQTPSSGFFLLSSRCSYELVEKTVIAACPMLVTISTATSLAVDRARNAGLRLIALARSDAVLQF